MFVFLDNVITIKNIDIDLLQQNNAMFYKNASLSMWFTKRVTNNIFI